MSALPGGAADKLGNRFELMWTVSELVHMLRGDAENIRIESPGVIKAEFVVTSAGRKVLHQAKRSHPSGKWTLAALANDGLLHAIFDQLQGNDARFVFVSGSKAEELHTLVERAQQSANLEEFESHFISGKEQRANFESLKLCWDGTDSATTYDVLRRIEVRVSDEWGLENAIDWGLRALFLTDQQAIASELRALAQDSVHKTITRDGLISHLAGLGYHLRHLRDVPNAALAIQQITTDYLTCARRKLIQDILISRDATAQLLKRLELAEAGSDSVLTGTAGSGKTACVVELVDAARHSGMPVLAFRLDRIKPVTTAVKLGNEIGLEESPALVLQAAATTGEALLVIDQLDAVSSLSGHSLDLLDAVEDLLAEVRGLRGHRRLHVVLACRAFDWENDHRFRSLRLTNGARVSVSEFSAEETKAVLAKAGFAVQLFQSRQIALLRLPQNLALFLDGTTARSSAPLFGTAKDLFDNYWAFKRGKVAQQAQPAPCQWCEVIDTLCAEMAQTQQLSVTRELLDRYEQYANRMVSEGVLTYDGKRYGFAHESFFDYCFARAFAGRALSLPDFLASAEQHLFRRSQVRQVLAYLRDADRVRYSRELSRLLTDDRIRTHLKDMALAFLMAVPDPTSDEWGVIEPWLTVSLAASEKGITNEDKFSALVWQHFFVSESWFHFADNRGLPSQWLASGISAVNDMAALYMRAHQRHSSDRVAELLEPYAGKSAEWTKRLRFIVEWADHSMGRMFFDLVLRLVDNGTLDEARGPIASNSTFWCMFYDLEKTHPGWVAELLAHWLRRRMILINRVQGDATVNWKNLFNHDNFGRDTVYEAAHNAPCDFVRHVLPAVLEISDAAAYKGRSEHLQRDAVWPALIITEHESLDAAVLTSLAGALKTCGETPHTFLTTIVRQLQSHDTFVANILLLKIFAGGVKHMSNDTVALLCREPWRFHCGYSDNPYWLAMELIRALVPCCNVERRVELESAILAFTPEYERSPEGHKSFGRACFALLSCFDEDKLTPAGKTRLGELQRKFSVPIPAPRGVRTFWVGSPIDKTDAQMMTDEQWLNAISKYNSEERPYRWDSPEKGGASQLAALFQEFTKNDPIRFARLGLQFPIGTNPIYIIRLMDGLKESTTPVDLKLEVCRKAFSEIRNESGKAVADLLGSIQDRLPDEAVQMLSWLATEHPDPLTDVSPTVDDAANDPFRGDLYAKGMNTTRGRAAEGIRDLIWRDPEYVARFKDAINHLLEDKSVAVQSCVVSLVYAIASHDIFLALRLFAILMTRDARLFGTPYVDPFLAMALQQHFVAVRPYVERMLRSDDKSVNETGARLASLAVLYGGSADDLVLEALSGDPAQRLGVAQVAAHNIGQPECRGWCEHQLLTLFNDTDPKVRGRSASCFTHLKDVPLEMYETLIRSFCSSAAYAEDSHSILHLFETSVHRLPGLTCEVVSKFMERFNKEARDIRTHRAADVYAATPLVFRTYQQHQNDEWGRHCLDLIDRMCLECIPTVNKGMDEFER
jgi:hypothetical protein